MKYETPEMRISMYEVEDVVVASAVVDESTEEEEIGGGY